MSADEQRGHKPPPKQSQFQPGRSGNVSGRPKGAISLHKLTAKVALGRHHVTIDGRRQRKTLMELVVRTLRAMALKGQPAAVAEWMALNRELRPEREVTNTGVLVVPEVLSVDAWIAREALHNARIEEVQAVREWEAAALIKIAGGKNGIVVDANADVSET